MSDSDNSNIKISVILPVYNVEKYLHRCMDSILCQTMEPKDFEVIMVDDGAKDGSPAICDEYSAKYDNFIVIHQPIGGAAAARNTGLEAAHGKYVVFVDPDDYITADYLEVAYNTARKHGADITIFDAVRESNVTVDGKFIRRTDHDKLRDRMEMEGNFNEQLWNHAPSSFVTCDKDDILSMRCQILYPYMASKVGKMEFTKDIPLSAPWDKCFRRAFLTEKKLKFPSQLKVLDDMTFNFMAFGEAGKIAYVKRPLYHYCIEPDSITNSYKENRPELDMQVFEYLYSAIQNNFPDMNLPIGQAYYARIIKSFAICCRLCFFNDKNPRPAKERLEQVRSYMDMEPYIDAFACIRMKNIDYKLKAVTIAGRLGSPRMLRFLDRLQNK